MGQVWSSADFDGVTETGFQGGRGGPLAVTLQNPGSDGIDGTADDVTAVLNQSPCHICVDFEPNDACGNPMDRCRNFISAHVGGAQFLMGDGSVQFVSENIDSRIYRLLSTISDGEVIGQF